MFFIIVKNNFCQNNNFCKSYLTLHTVPKFYKLWFKKNLHSVASKTNIFHLYIKKIYLVNVLFILSMENAFLMLVPVLTHINKKARVIYINLNK